MFVVGRRPRRFCSRDDVFLFCVRLPLPANASSETINRMADWPRVVVGGAIELPVDGVPGPSHIRGQRLGAYLSCPRRVRFNGVTCVPSAF